MVTHQFNNPPTNNVKAGDPVGSKNRCEQFYGTPCRYVYRLDIYIYIYVRVPPGCAGLCGY